MLEFLRSMENTGLIDFHFPSFARQIHEETRSALQDEPYLLPALYGGELGPDSEYFEAIIVLHEPLLSITRKFWGTPCDTTEMAVRRHRDVFVQQWAYQYNPFHFFTLLDELHSHRFMPSTQEFFGHYYVTDVWKDAAPKKKRNEEEYRRYWRSKLRMELQSVPAKRIILVGSEAAQDEILEFCKGTTTHQTVFPGRRVSKSVLQTALSKLGDEIRATL
jgi:hypothetical protein